jgi:hypothetical protein
MSDKMTELPDYYADLGVRESGRQQEIERLSAKVGEAAGFAN